MRRILFMILAASFLPLVSGCGSDSHPDVLMLRPHESLPEGVDENRYEKIFLAGTIDMGNSRDWQTDIFETFLENADGRYIFYNPRQENWDASRPGEMDYQVNWELEHLEKADRILMYIIGTSKSPISLLEMGLHMRSGRMTVVCEPDYYRYDNVRITCAFYDVPLYHSLADALSGDRVLHAGK